MEILRPNPAPGRLRQAMFDFDGTLSLVRTGWQRVMADLIVAVLGPRPRARRRPCCARIRRGDLWAGGPAHLVQMEWLADRWRQRGGKPLAAEAYKAEYLPRINERVHHLADLRAGRSQPEQCDGAGGVGVRGRAGGAGGDLLYCFGHR